MLPVRRHGHDRPAAQRCNLCKGSALDRDPRRGDGRPQRLRLSCATTATTPSASRASPSAWASSASRCSSTASPTCACSTTTTCASWSSSADAPAARVAARPRAPRAVRRASWPTRLAMTGTEVDRIQRHGVGALDAFVVGQVLAAERHPDADRLTVCRVDVGLAGDDDRLRRAQRRHRPDRRRRAARRGHARRHDARPRHGSAASSPTG